MGVIRKRWITVAVALATLTVSITLLSVPKPDGLEVIRKYHPLSEKLVMRQLFNVAPPHKLTDTLWVREFKFDKIPDGLVKDLTQGRPLTSNSRINFVKLDDGSFVLWNTAQGGMSVQMAGEPPWLVRQWHAVTRWVSGTKSR